MESVSIETLYDRHNILLTKIDDCNYGINVLVSNPRLPMTKIFTFEWLKVVMDIQQEFIEEYKIFKKDEDNADIFILIKHFFKDFGINQFFINIKVSLNRGEEGLTVHQINNECHDLIKDRINDTMIQVPTNHSRGNIIFITNDTVRIEGIVKFEYYIETPEFIEKMGIILCTKLIRLLKDFIEGL